MQPPVTFEIVSADAIVSFRFTVHPSSRLVYASVTLVEHCNLKARKIARTGDTKRCSKSSFLLFRKSCWEKNFLFPSSTLLAPSLLTSHNCSRKCYTVFIVLLALAHKALFLQGQITFRENDFRSLHYQVFILTSSH